jgi:hypothetical protein
MSVSDTYAVGSIHSIVGRKAKRSCFTAVLDFRRKLAASQQGCSSKIVIFFKSSQLRASNETKLMHCNDGRPL